jgi:hypothetical protein
VGSASKRLHAFATLGCVILIERPRLLNSADAEMQEALSYHLRPARPGARNEEVPVLKTPDGT